MNRLFAAGLRAGRRGAGRAIRRAGIFFTFWLAAGCKPAPTAVPTAPPATVTVAHPVEHSVMEWDEYTGRLEATEFVDVRARVSGLIMSASFPEGALVQQGDCLVEIDVRPYQAELNAKRAAAARATAQLNLAEIEYRRVDSIPEAARSSTEFDKAAADVAEAKAVLAGAEAMVESARLNVEWCYVKAPIAGRVSRRLVTPGNLVTGGSGTSTLLTTIASVDPIYCYVNTDERAVLKYAKLARSGDRVSARQARIPTYLQLTDETGFPHAGEVDFVDNRVDPATGTIRGRGVFPNSDGWLLPGLFARVRIPGSGRYTALLVPDAAIMTDQSQKVLMVVTAENEVQPRSVKLGALFGELRAIVSGVSTSDRVIINGLMLARPGARVNPIMSEISLDSLRSEMPSPPPGPAASPETRPMTLNAGDRP